MRLDRDYDPVAREYHQRVNREAREAAIATGRYVTVKFGDDAPNSRGMYGLTYDPAGEAVLSSGNSKETIDRLVTLANAALDAGVAS